MGPSLILVYWWRSSFFEEPWARGASPFIELWPDCQRRTRALKSRSKGRAIFMAITILVIFLTKKKKKQFKLRDDPEICRECVLSAETKIMKAVFIFGS